jgi:hypothetical protein
MPRTFLFLSRVRLSLASVFPLREVGPNAIQIAFSEEEEEEEALEGEANSQQTRQTLAQGWEW